MIKKLLLILLCLISFGVKAQFGYFNLKYYDSVGIEAPKLKIRNTIQGSTSDSLIVKTQSNFEIKRLAVNQLPFLTSAPVSSVFGRTGVVVSANGDYNTGQVAEGVNLYYTPARFNTAFSTKSTTDLSEGTNQYFTNTRARSSISALLNGGINYNNSTGEFSQTPATYNNSPGRALTTSFRPSTVRPTRVSYTISIATTLSLLNLNSSGAVALQISPDNSTWTTINSAGINRTLAISISVGLNDTSLLNVAGEIPTGYYCRLLPTTSGGATITFSSGQEVTY